MTMLLENPLPILFVGVVVEAVLAVILVQTGRGALLWAMGGVVLLVLALLGIERFVVTERERVEATLDGIVDAIEANDLQRALAYVSPSAAETRRRAEWAMNRIEVRNASIHKVEITINRLTSPPTARAHFDATLQFDDRQHEYPYHSYFSPITVELQRERGRWLVTGHVEEAEGVGGTP